MTDPRQLELVQAFIDQFNPDEFSSNAELIKSLSQESRLDNARRLRGKIQRKRQISEKMHAALATHDFGQAEVLITQDQIDALLASAV
jgi:hypothetical protein